MCLSFLQSVSFPQKQIRESGHSSWEISVSSTSQIKHIFSHWQDFFFCCMHVINKSTQQSKSDKPIASMLFICTGSWKNTAMLSNSDIFHLSTARCVWRIQYHNGCGESKWLPRSFDTAPSGHMLNCVLHTHGVNFWAQHFKLTPDTQGSLDVNANVYIKSKYTVFVALYLQATRSPTWIY